MLDNVKRLVRLVVGLSVLILVIICKEVLGSVDDGLGWLKGKLGVW